VEFLQVAQICQRLRSVADVEGETNMAPGEATARQPLEGVLFSREALGTRPFTLLAPNTFGQAGNLPQLALSAGAERSYHHRANPDQAERWPAERRGT
jgi:alpha-mannosidase